jgi:hypothetical protein
MTSTKTSTTLGRNAIQQHVATAIMDHVAKNLLKSWSPRTHAGITKEQALDAARQVFGYVPPAAWSYSTPHPVYGVRNVGRPAPKQTAPASKTTARPGRSASKTSTAPKTTARKGAPKSAPKSGTPTPATVARSASKSTAPRKVTASK